MTYSGSPNAYFRQLPNLDYPSLNNDRSSAYDYQIVKNIFKRAVMRDDVFDSAVNFQKYSVKADERQDQVAARFYNDPALDWVVLTTNNVIHVRDEWPMGSQDFLTYLNAKYTSEQLSNIHHYEWEYQQQSVQFDGTIIPKKFYIVDESTYNSKLPDERRAVSYYVNEQEINDNKRTINILKDSYVPQFLREAESIFE